MAAPSKSAVRLIWNKNSQANLCSHDIFIVFFKFSIELLMVMVSINYFSKSEHFYISIVFVSVQNKKVTGGST